MCGIIGYAGGTREASQVLLTALGRMEYRGYDSIGITVQSADGLAVRKTVGRLPHLTTLLAEQPVAGRCGIGHTRWATHGGVTQVNAHPHIDCSGDLAVVHNGIIENAEALRRQLEERGHRFITETDTEVIAHLIESTSAPTLATRVRLALGQLEGTYGLIVISAAAPGQLIAARRGSPVLLGVGQGETFIASDPGALAGYTRSVVYLHDGDVAVVDAEGYHVLDAVDLPQDRVIDAIEWGVEAVSLGDHPTFMWKEICEQPSAVANVMRGRLLPDEGTTRLNGLQLSDDDCRTMERIRLLGCGTSWHAALVGRHILEELAGIPVEVDYASEFRYRRAPPSPGTVTVAISQSGETADTLEAIRAAKAGGSRILGIVNAVSSSIARETDGGIYLHAGPEIGVASTKAFTAQLVALLMLGIRLGRARGLSRDTGRALITELQRLPELIEKTLALASQVHDVATAFADAQSAIYLGRGPQHPVALEGALKLKEISYIHAEGYPAAEMKHGPLALIDADMPVVFLAPRDHTFPKMLSNIREVQARGGKLVAVTTAGNGVDLRDYAAHEIVLPTVSPLVAPILSVIPLQMLAYAVAIQRGCDVDRPRHLAKSVTVE